MVLHSARAPDEARQCYDQAVASGISAEQPAGRAVLLARAQLALLADIDGSSVVWARDLGPAENEKLQRYYPDRTEWLLEPDAKPARLSRYAATGK